MNIEQIKKRIATIQSRKHQIEMLIQEEEKEVKHGKEEHNSNWTGLTQLEWLKKLQEEDLKELNELALQSKRK